MENVTSEPAPAQVVPEQDSKQKPSVRMENFTAIRNGILDHIQAGHLKPFDLGVYLFLHLRADWSTGIYHGCALTIAYQFGDPTLKEHIQKALRRLRDRKYVNYRKGDGKKSGYPILLNKFFVTVGEQSGCRLNAWKHGELCLPEYEPWNGHGTVVARSRNSGGTVVAPIQDLKTSQDVQDEEETPALSKPESARPTTSPRCGQCGDTGWIHESEYIVRKCECETGNCPY